MDARLVSVFSLLISMIFLTDAYGQWERPDFISIDSDPSQDQKQHQNLVKAIEFANSWINEQQKDFNLSGLLPDGYKPDPAQPTRLAASQNYWFSVRKVRELSEINTALQDENSGLEKRSSLETQKAKILQETKEFANKNKEGTSYSALEAYLYSVKIIDELVRQDFHNPTQETKEKLEARQNERAALVEILVNIGPIVKDEVLELRSVLYQRAINPLFDGEENLQAVINKLDYLLARIDQAKDDLSAEEFWKNYMERIGKETKCD